MEAKTTGVGGWGVGDGATNAGRSDYLLAALLQPPVPSPEPLVLHHVSYAAHGVNQLPLVPGVDLLAKVVDHHVDDVRPRIEVVAPRVLGDQRAAHDAAGVAHQILEDGELLRRQLD